MVHRVASTSCFSSFSVFVPPGFGRRLTAKHGAWYGRELGLAWLRGAWRVKGERLRHMVEFPITVFRTDIFLPKKIRVGNERSCLVHSLYCRNNSMVCRGMPKEGVAWRGGWRDMETPPLNVSHDIIEVCWRRYSRFIYARRLHPRILA